MFNRKRIRAILRARGKRLGARPSRYVREEFNRRQINEYGPTVRRINQAKSTTPRRAWRERILLALAR